MLLTSALAERANSKASTCSACSTRLSGWVVWWSCSPARSRSEPTPKHLCYSAPLLRCVKVLAIGNWNWQHFHTGNIFDSIRTIHHNGFAEHAPDKDSSNQPARLHVHPRIHCQSQEHRHRNAHLRKAQFFNIVGMYGFVKT